MTISLMTQYFKDNMKERQQEIDYCMERNCKNKLIDNIYLFTDEKDSKPSIVNKKIQHINLNRRLTFNDCIHYANKHLNNHICIISNVDIYFDGSLDRLNKASLDNKMLAITRYEFKNDKEAKLWY